MNTEHVKLINNFQISDIFCNISWLYNSSRHKGNLVKVFSKLHIKFSRVMTMKISVLLNVTPCSLLEENCCSCETYVNLYRLHGDTSYKIVFFVTSTILIVHTRKYLGLNCDQCILVCIMEAFRMMTEMEDRYFITLYIYTIICYFFTWKCWSYIKLYSTQDTEIYFSKINCKCWACNKYYTHLLLWQKNNRISSWPKINHLTRKLHLNVVFTYEINKAL